MDDLTQYDIPVRTLVVGSHEFKYDLDDSFFEKMESQEISGGKVLATVVVERSNYFMKLFITMEGKISLPCDRCLDLMTLPVEIHEEMMIKISEHLSLNDEDCVVLSPQEEFYNIARDLYDFIAVSIPISHYHPEGECNAEMMEVLNRLEVDRIEDNEDNFKENEDNEVDPRWAALKNISDNN